MRARHLLTLLLILVPATPAGAAFFPADSLDGPSADIVSAGEVDFARDGDGAVVYVKRDGGVEHIFAVRMADGVWQPPERVDAGIATASSRPVIGVADNDGLVKPKAYVVLKSGQQASAEDLQAHVKSLLAPYKYPRWIAFVPELPKTATGKIQRFKLRAAAAA